MHMIKEAQGAGDIAQSVECLISTREALGLMDITVQTRPGGVHTGNPGDGGLLPLCHYSVVCKPTRPQ